MKLDLDWCIALLAIVCIVVSVPFWPNGQDGCTTDTECAVSVLASD